jgi:hypothetical protein
MAEPMDTGPATPRSGFLGKITSWVKKNKMVAALVAGGAALLLIKKGSGEGAHIINSEGEEEGASSIQLVPVSVSKSSAEEFEPPEEAERPEIPEREEEEQPVQEEKEEPAGAEPPEPPEASQPPPVTTGHGVIIHGREFPAATSFKQTRNGKDQKGSYIEYLVEFPGFTQRWHYYPNSNDWIKAGDSRESGGGSKPPIKSPPPNKTPPPPGNGGGGGGQPTPKPTPKPPMRKPPIGVGPGHPVGKPPAGGGGGGGGGGGAPVCPAGTVQNIQQNRAEVQRLQGEINTLQSYIAAHPNAKQVPEWRANIANKQQVRDQCQGAVDRGRAQPGCGGV